MNKKPWIFNNAKKKAMEFPAGSRIPLYENLKKRGCNFNVLNAIDVRAWKSYKHIFGSVVRIDFNYQLIGG